ncbi:MAG: hypothetical protein AB2L20_14885 [Mangrovibacterium sp.]
MSWKLNNIDLSDYGILPGRMANSHIAVSGCFDLPARIGDTYHEWDDEDGIEPYVDADELFFAGRDITFQGLIRAGRSSYWQLKQLYDTIDTFTGPVAFETPYGTFNVLVSSITPTHYNGMTEIEMKLREPVVTLTGGVLPATGSGRYKIDGIQTEAFGLYISTQKDRTALSDSKQQYFLKHGEEGYQITKRKAKKLTLTGFVKGNSVADFISKIKGLYLLFSSEGLRTLNLHNEIEVQAFAVDGFKVTNVLVAGDVVASFSIELMLTGEGYYTLLNYAGNDILTFDSNNIII